MAISPVGLTVLCRAGLAPFCKVRYIRVFLSSVFMFSIFFHPSFVKQNGFATLATPFQVGSTNEASPTILSCFSRISRCSSLAPLSWPVSGFFMRPSSHSTWASSWPAFRPMWEPGRRRRKEKWIENAGHVNNERSKSCEFMNWNMLQYSFHASQDLSPFANRVRNASDDATLYLIVPACRDTLWGGQPLWLFGISM